MELNIEEIKKITLGAVDITAEEQGFLFHRFTKEQENFYRETNNNFYLKGLSPSGVKLFFKTDSSSLFIKGTTTEHPSRKYFGIDVFVNGESIGSINNFEGRTLSSPYTVSDLPTGDFEKNFDLGFGVKEVKVFLPWSAITYFSEISLDDNAFITPIKENKKVLFFGDSITQGYDALYPSNRYTSKLASLLGAEEINKAIGAEKFTPSLAALKDDFTPDYIIVAYGTNDWGGEREFFCRQCAAFYETISKNYPHSKIFAITPIWRSDCDETRPFGPFCDIESEIRNAASPLSNVVVIRGFDLVPKKAEYYADFRLHPNDKGFEHQAKNLYEQIKKYI